MIPKFYPDKTREYWDCDIKRGSEKALANFVKALVLFQGKLHDAFALGPDDFSNIKWHHRTVFTRISLPVAAKEDFETFTGIKLKPPPTIQIN